MADSDPRPETIEMLANSVYPAFAMLAGIQLDLFTPLKDGPLNADQIADALQVRPDKLNRLLYALLAAKLLNVEGDLFSNSSEADLFLVRGKPTYIGDGWHQAIGRRWNGVLKTAETIRTGVPQQKTDFATMPPDRMESICRSYESETVASARELLTRHDFSAFRTLLDVGGGAGYLSIEITKAVPALRATVVDLPSITPIAQRVVSEAGAGDRVQVIETDVVNDPLSGIYEAAVVSNLIQVLSAEDASRALNNVGYVIEPGGSLFIVGRIIDDSRITPMEIVGSNLVFLNAYDEGQAYTEGEYRGWLTEAGFEDIERVVLPNKESIIRARKTG